ncbi:MAG: F0F1 ATP synthase subunit A [Defluviitaleaceae bacterium]|nr:F0F1 ATP synthase subunit A [Defluviitaleaceae bacterium]
MNFDVRNLGVINIGPIEIWITESIVVAWAIMALLIVFAIIVRVKLRNFKDIPTGFQNFVEIIVEAFEGLVIRSAGPKLAWIGGWFFTVFAFLMLSNMSGLILFIRPPTADWPVPLGLALITFLLIHFAGIRYRGWDYIKSFFEPIFIFFPVNVLGEISKPIALSFRLFGNVLGGMILVSLVYGLAPMVVQLFLPPVLHLYFDVFAGTLQAFIFTVLSLTFVGVAATHSSET